MRLILLGFIFLLITIQVHAETKSSIQNCNEILSQMMLHPHSRATVISNLKNYYQKQSQQLKNLLINNPDKNQIEFDVVIVGGGPATVAFIAGIRSINSNLKILVIDESSTLSPTFEGPGKALIFNSQTIPNNTETINSHHFPGHFLQLPDFLDFNQGNKIYPTGEDIAAMTWSQFSRLDSQILLNTRAQSIEQANNSSKIILQTSEGLKIPTQLLILATGQGKPRVDFLDIKEKELVLKKVAANENDSELLGIETYLQALTYINSKALDPIKYENKKIAIIGGGDSAMGMIEILMALKVPSLAYGINQKKRRPAKIVNYGFKVTPPNRKKFMESNKHRYHHLRGIGGLFMDKELPLPRDTEDLRPWLEERLVFQDEKVDHIQILPNKKVLITNAIGGFEEFDHVILATGYTNEVAQLFNSQLPSLTQFSYDNTPNELVPLIGDVVIQGGSYPPGSHQLTSQDIHYSNVRLGFQYTDQAIYLIANAAGAQLIVNDDEALDGSNGAFSKRVDKFRSSTFSKYTLQHMMPRAHEAGYQLTKKHFKKML
ncbi:MAG: FAD-dependent oxidoreductase [Bdellovibrionaceae bacterium]|nr:FAD-dependent oxidoreductase [Pseudobdellovibrionaceae bacterium]